MAQDQRCLHNNVTQGNRRFEKANVARLPCWRRFGKTNLLAGTTSNFMLRSGHIIGGSAFMEPVTTAIVAALSSGGTFVFEKAATEAVKDAYAAVKVWIHDRYPDANVSVDQLEKQPASKARQEVVGEDLERAGASTDTKLVKLAQILVVLIRKQAPDVARSIGVDLGELDQANVTFGNVLAGKGAIGVKVDSVKGGSLQFGDVTASADPELPKKA